MERPYRPLTGESAFRRFTRTSARLLFYPLLWIAFVPLYGLRVKDRHHLRGPAVSVMNHCIYVEWFFLWHAVRPRYIRFTAEEANMKRRDLGWFNRLLGVLGIPEKSPMAVAPGVSYALGRGELVHFFPEGELVEKNQYPSEFFIGAAWFACRHNVPFIPVAEILHPRKIQKRLPWWPPKIELQVCPPLYPMDFIGKDGRLRHAARKMTEESEKIIRKTIKERLAELSE